MGLHQRLDAQRARRAAAQAVASRGGASGAGRALAGATRPQGERNAQISLSYAELLKIMAQATIHQSAVILTGTGDNVYLKVADRAEAPVTGAAVGALIELELAVRDRMEAVVARRYLAMQGLDFLVGEDATDNEVERPRA